MPEGKKISSEDKIRSVKEYLEGKGITSVIPKR